MNIYEKLQLARVDLGKLDLPKSGFNSFGKFKYYELSDLCPSIDDICLKYKMTHVVDFTQTEAKLTLINCETPEETVSVSSPLSWADLKGGQKITNVGATHTFFRRYLLLLAFNVTEGDVIDSLSAEDRQAPEPVKPKDTEREKLLAEIQLKMKDNPAIKDKLLATIKNTGAKSTSDLTVESLKSVLAE